jgi:hypothetical protein
MTVVRRSAMGIAAFVVRYAAPGCRDWAEGLAREVEFIEGDWAAFWWSLGSMRVLLDRREATVSSLNEAAAQARQFSQALRNGGFANGRMFATAFTTLEIFYALNFLNARNIQQRIWCGVVVLTAIYIEISMERNIRRRRLALVPPNDDDAVAWVLYYKSELEYRCSYDFSIRSFIPLFLLNASALLAERVGVRGNPVVGMLVELIFVCLTLFFLWKRQQFQRQIEALEVILRETR